MSGVGIGSRAVRPLAGAGALLLAFGLGLVLGRSEPGHGTPPAHALAAPATAGPARAPIGAARQARPSDSGHAHAHAAPRGELLEQGPQGETRALPPLDLEAVLAAARAAHADPVDEALCDAAEEAANALELAVLSDARAKAAALGRLRAAQDPAELEFLAAVLGRVRDLAVEEAAVELTRAASPAAQAAGYDMLDALDLPAARSVALEGLARAREPAVRRSALNALPVPAGASLDDAREVVGTLGALVSGDRDPELRRRAAIELGRWHRGVEDLAPVLTALERDPDPAVRAGAAFGLELAVRRDPLVVEALVRVLRRPDEDPLVRENAWRALSALGPLPPEVQAEWRRFHAQLGAQGDG